MINKKRRGTAVFFMLFFIIDYRGISRKTCMFFFRQIILFINLILFLFFSSRSLFRVLCGIFYSAFSVFSLYIYLQKIHQKNFLKKYAKTLDKLFFTNYNMGEFSNQSKRVLTFKNKECQTFRTVSESRALR